MLKEIAEWVRKSAAQIFTWPGKYRAEQSHDAVTVTGRHISPEGALSCSAVAACVRLISETIAFLPAHVYRDANESKERATDHPVQSLLESAPNSLQTAFTWKQQLMAQVLLHGNHYSLIERNAKGEPRALWPLNPRGVTVEAVAGTIRYRYYWGARKDNYDAADMLHFKGPTLDGLVGMSIIGMAREAIGVAEAAQEYSARFFQNDGKPSGVITGGIFKTLEDEEKFRDKWQKWQTGVNRHKTAIMLPGMEYKPIGISPDDMEALEGRKFSVVEIARFFRVPPTMIGDMTRVSYSSSESELGLFQVHTIVPWCANLESEINAKLFPARSKFSAKFDVNSLSRGDQQSRYNAYNAGIAGGFLTVADVRLAEGLPFIPGSDQLNRPANLVPNTGEHNNGPHLPAA